MLEEGETACGQGARGTLERLGGEGARERGDCRWRVLEEGETGGGEGARQNGDCRWGGC